MGVHLLSSPDQNSVPCPDDRNAVQPTNNQQAFSVHSAKGKPFKNSGAGSEGFLLCFRKLEQNYGGEKGKASISKAHPQRKDHRAGAEGKHNSSIIQKTKLHIFTLLSEAFAFKRSDLSGLSARCSLFFL